MTPDGRFGLPNERDTLQHVSSSMSNVSYYKGIILLISKIKTRKKKEGKRLTNGPNDVKYVIWAR